MARESKIDPLVHYSLRAIVYLLLQFLIQWVERFNAWDRDTVDVLVVCELRWVCWERKEQKLTGLDGQELLSKVNGMPILHNL